MGILVICAIVSALVAMGLTILLGAGPLGAFLIGMACGAIGGIVAVELDDGW